jgi:hypothetical protein
MSESIPHVVHALRTKRDEIFRQIGDLERRATKLRAQLATLDAATSLLVPGHSREVVKQRTRYFARNELVRLVMDALRKAERPLGLSEIAAYAMQAKGLPVSASGPVAGMVATVLTKQVTHGSITKTGKARGTRWLITSP